jgi:hypothetical protein
MSNLARWEREIAQLLARYKRGGADESERVALIRTQNDFFRATGKGGVMFMTAAIDERPDKAMILKRTLTFLDFTPENDPHKEHDFGSFELAGHKFLWKIDYYDKSMAHGSEDPADPEQTTRVLTVMLAGEY